MPFSAEICLTDIGTTALGPTLTLFSDVDNFNTPFVEVNTADVTGANCPYTLENIIPNGTLTIKVVDYESSCCVEFDLQNNDLCTVCNFSFSSFINQQPAIINVGDLIGNCNTEITDFVINWYGPNNSETLSFTSGVGSEFEYDFPHPLIGNQSLLVECGEYFPIIDKVVYNGQILTSSSGTTFFSSNLDCLDSVTVECLNCNNGNQPAGGNWTHNYSYEGSNESGDIPYFSTELQITNSINFFAWGFNAENEIDTLKILYHGEAYENPIVLDNISVGSNLTSTNLSLTTFNKTVELGFMKHVISLEGLTRSIDESLEIIVESNSPSSIWSLSFKCMTDFDCDMCFAQEDNNYKIKLDDLVVTDNGCGTSIHLEWDACDAQEYQNTQFYNYMNSPMFTNGFTQFQGTFDFQISDSIEFNGFQVDLVCNPPNPSTTINFVKTVVNGVGLITITFNQYETLEFFYEQYQNQMNVSTDWGCSSCDNGCVPYPDADQNGFGPFSGGTSENNIPSYLDPTDLRYYRYLRLFMPIEINNTECGSDTGQTVEPNFNNTVSFVIHPSAIVTTGGTGPYTLQITMSLMDEDFQVPTEICDSLASLVSNMYQVVNESSYSTANNYNFTSNVGSFFTTPFKTYAQAIRQCPNNEEFFSLPSFNQGGLNLYKYMLITLPFDSITEEPIYSASAQTCDYGGCSTIYFDMNFEFFRSVYKIEKGVNGTDFTIFASPITNFSFSGCSGSQYGFISTDAMYDTALTYSNGQVTYVNSEYIVV